MTRFSQAQHKFGRAERRRMPPNMHINYAILSYRLNIGHYTIPNRHDPPLHIPGKAR